MKKGIIITILILSIITCNKVKAVTITQDVNEAGWSRLNQGSYESWFPNQSLNTDGERFVITVDPSETIQSRVFVAKLDSKNIEGHDYIEIPLMVALPANYVNNEYSLEVQCSNWTQSGSSYYCNNWTTNTGTTPVEITGIMDSMHIGANVIMEDNSKAYCTIQNNTLICPVYQKKVKELWFEILYRSNNLGQLMIKFDRNWVYYDKQTTTQAIKEQTQQQIESQMVCSNEIIDKNDIIERGYLNTTGGVTGGITSSSGTTDYYEIKSNVKIIKAGGNRYCLYNENKEYISCSTSNNTGNITIPNTAKYIRFSISISDNIPQFELVTCKNGNQGIIDSDHIYDKNATEDYTNQTNEIQNITNAEDTLMQNLDFNTTEMNITINPNASTFIWNVVDSLRSISTKIVLLMTSLLSIGIIKLVLNR